MIKKRKDTNPKEGEKKYGNVNYADETNKKYPLDTAAHVKAASSYWGMSKNKSKYSAEDQKKISAKIAAAEKKFGIGEHSVPVGEIVIFRSGEHETKDGKKVKYTDADLDELCETFPENEDEQPAFIVGHSSDYSVKTAIPAFGRVRGYLKRVGHDLIAGGSEFSDVLASWVKDGYYTERSIETQKTAEGKRRLFAVAMLGAIPPAVKGMPSILSALENPALAFSSPGGETEEFADTIVESIEWESLEDIAIESLIEDVKGCADELVKTLTEELVQDGEDKDDDPEYLAQVRSNVFNALYTFQDTIVNKVRGHFEFQDTVNEMEEEDESKLSEMATKIKDLAMHYFSKGKNLLTNQQKESDMDKDEKAAYEKTIADQKKQIDEFSVKQAETEKKVKEDAQKAADDKLRASVHEFCVKNGFDTNKAKELKVEETLFIAAKADEMVEFSQPDKTSVKKSAFEALQGIFVALNTSPKPGEMSEFSQPDPSSKEAKTLVDKAKSYVEKHHTEFSGKTDAEAVSYVIEQHVNHQINLNQN